MGWPAQLHTHPAYDTLERKCRRFVGLLDNEEERLREDGVDLSETREFIRDLWKRAMEMEDRAERDPAARAAYEAEARRLDPELRERFEKLVQLVERYHPESGGMVNWRIYSKRWLDCVGEPRQEAPADDDSDAGGDEDDIQARWESPVYGVPWKTLKDVRQAIYSLNLEDRQILRDAAAWTVFLCGLFYAGDRIKRELPAPEHDYDDGLREAAREAWQEGVDVALRDESVALIEEHAAVLGSIETGQMFLAVTYSARAHTADVYAWLHEWDFRDALHRMIFAMGVQAANTPYGRQLRLGLGSAESVLHPLQVAPGLIRVLKSFVDEVESME